MVVALPKIFNINPPAPAVTPPPTPPPPTPPNYQTDSQFCGTSASDAVNCNANGTGYSCVGGVCKCQSGICSCSQQSGGTCNGINQRCTSGGCACNSQGGTTLTYCSDTSACHDLLAGENPTYDGITGEFTITKCGYCTQSQSYNPIPNTATYGLYKCCGAQGITELRTQTNCSDCFDTCNQSGATNCVENLGNPGNFNCG